MSALLTTAAAAAPLAGWSMHTLWMRRRLDRARRDPLTGLHTRRVFEETAARMLSKEPCAVLVIDLDGFKQINDRYGHAAGDAAITAAGTTLARYCEGLGGFPARLGGDEFAVVMPVRHASGIARRLAELHDILGVPVWFERQIVPLGASIGAVWSGELPDPTVQLTLRRADEAMYTAKRSGGGWHIAYGPASTHQTANGRRAGRDGTHHHEGRTAA